MKDRARTLRHRMSDAEHRLWYHLRARRMAGLKFRRQHPIGPYFADFACLEIGLVIEADGGQHTAKSEYDAKRTECMRDAGYTVLRFWNHEILRNTEAVLQRIHDEIVRLTADDY